MVRVGVCGVLGDTVRLVTNKHEKLPSFVTHVLCSLVTAVMGSALGCLENMLSTNKSHCGIGPLKSELRQAEPLPPVGESTSQVTFLSATLVIVT